VETGVRK